MASFRHAADQGTAPTSTTSAITTVLIPVTRTEIFAMALRAASSYEGGCIHSGAAFSGFFGLGVDGVVSATREPTWNTVVVPETLLTTMSRLWPSHRDRIDGGVLAAGDLADLCGCSWVGGVQHVDLPAERIDGEDALGVRVERDDLGRRFVERASAVRTEHRDIGRSAVSDLFYRLADDGCPGVLRQAERECGGAGRSEAGAGNGGH